MAKTSAASAPRSRAASAPSRMSPARREAFWGLVFIGPWIIGFLLFTIGPLIASLVLSFTDFDLVRPEAMQFIGLENYARMAADPLVARACS